MARHDLGDLARRLEAAGGVAAELLLFRDVAQRPHAVAGIPDLYAWNRPAYRMCERYVEEVERRRGDGCDSGLATERQVTYILGLFAQLASRGNATPAGWVAGPPAEDILRGWPREEASRLIDALRAEL